jgi:AcrR family transcriptional regulator
MSKKGASRGVTKAEWVNAGLEFLARGNISLVTCEGLAACLGVSKSGMYWHFRNRDELLHELLKVWEIEMAGILQTNERLEKVNSYDHLKQTVDKLCDPKRANYEPGIRQWAVQNETANRALKRVSEMRMDYFRRLLSELNFTGAEAELRASLFVSFISRVPMATEGQSHQKWLNLTTHCVEFLTRK